MAQTSLLTPQRIASWKEARFNPIRYLTPETLSTYLVEFDYGTFDIAAQALMEMMERDGMICTVASKRFSKARGFQYEIAKKPDADDSEFEAQRDVLKQCYDNLILTDALDQDRQESIQGLFAEMVRAQGLKWQNFELLAMPNAATGGLTFKVVSCPLYFFENRKGKMRFLKSQGMYDGEEMEPNRWMIVRGMGLMKATAIAYMYAWIAVRDWLFYCEAHATPGVIGKTNATAGPAYDAMVELVGQVLGPNFRGVINQTDTVEAIHFSAQGQLPYEPIIEKHHKLIMQIWTGGNLSTDSAKSGDVGSTNQSEDAKCVEDADAQLITEALNFNIDKQVLEYHFGPGVIPAAYIKVTPRRQPDVANLTARYDFAIKNQIPLGQDAVREGLNLPIPEENEDLVEGPKPIEPAVKPGFGNRDEAPNSAANAVRSAMDSLQRNSLLLFADESSNAYQPLKDRVLGIVEIYEKAGEQAAKIALQKFAQDQPSILAEMNRLSGGKITALENMQWAALFNGAVESTVRTAA